jgi:hypothetical protein
MTAFLLICAVAAWAAWLFPAQAVDSVDWHSPAMRQWKQRAARAASARTGVARP